MHLFDGWLAGLRVSGSPAKPNGLFDIVNRSPSLPALKGQAMTAKDILIAKYQAMSYRNWWRGQIRRALCRELSPDITHQDVIDMYARGMLPPCFKLPATLDLPVSLSLVSACPH
jgi:hypothetical protein